MKVGELIHIIAQIDAIATAQGILTADGTFVSPDAAGWATFASTVEAQLKTDGVIVPEKVDLLIKALPAILTLLGI